MIDPVAFQDFVKENFDHPCTSLFVYQIQSLDRKFTCCLVHVDPEVNGKGNHKTVTGLQSISERAGNSICKIISYTFDGHSCFSGLRTEFRNTWELQYCVSGFAKKVTSDAILPLAVTDPLHKLKQIRYRFLSGELRVDADERIAIFTITKIKAAVKLLGTVFDNFRITQMHDSLPLRLFSRETILAAFGHLWKIELFVIFQWFLLVSGLTIEGVFPDPDAICSRSLFIYFIFTAN
jgi:hypothetical protein